MCTCVGLFIGPEEDGNNKGGAVGQIQWRWKLCAAVRTSYSRRRLRATSKYLKKQ